MSQNYTSKLAPMFLGAMASSGSGSGVFVPSCLGGSPAPAPAPAPVPAGPPPMTMENYPSLSAS